MSVSILVLIITGIFIFGGLSGWLIDKFVPSEEYKVFLRRGL